MSGGGRSDKELEEEAHKMAREAAEVARVHTYLREQREKE
jgi:hypothetical protein